MATSKREIVVELKIEDRGALARLGALEIETKQYQKELRALNAEIVKNGQATQQQLEKVGLLNASIRRNQTVIRELKNDLSGATDAGLRFRDKMADAAKAGLGAFGLNILTVTGAITGLVSVIKSSITTLANFEQANANLASILGVTVKEIDALKQSAIELGPPLGRLPEEVTNLQTELAKLGFTVPQILAAQEAIILLANATGEELAKSAEVAAATLKGFDLTAEDTQRIVDVMAQSFNSTSLDLEKFSVAMSTLAPAAKAAGLSLEETTSLVGILADRGIDASVVGTSLRSIFIDLSKTGGTLEDALTKINASTNKTKTAFELFGERAAGAAVILAENVDQSDKLEDAFNRAGGAAKLMADTQLNTLEGASNQLAGAWNALILEGGKLNDILKSLALTSADFISSVSDASDGSRSFADRAASATDALTLGLVSAEDYSAFLSKITFGYIEAGTEAAKSAAEVTKFNDAVSAPVEAGPVSAPVTTIASLREEVKKLKEAREGLSITDKQGLADNAAQTTALEAQIKALDGTTQSVKKLTAAQIERLAVEKEMAAIASQAPEVLQPIETPLPQATPLTSAPEAAQTFLDAQEALRIAQITGTETLNLELLALDEQFYEEKIIGQEEYNARKKVLLDNDAEEQRQNNALLLSSAAQFFGGLADLTEQGTAEYKALATVQALVNTYLGATLALTDKTIPNAFVRIAAAVAVIASGLASVRKIQGFAEGGKVKKNGRVTEAWGEPVNRSNGDTVLATLKPNEAVLNEDQQSRARRIYGDDFFKRIGVPGFAVGGRVSSTRGTALVNFPSVPRPSAGEIANVEATAEARAFNFSPVVSVVEMNRVQDRVRVIQSLSTA